jgi:hypothetical protein
MITHALPVAVQRGKTTEVLVAGQMRCRRPRRGPCGGGIRRRAGYNRGVSLDVLLRHLGRVYGNPLPPGVTLAEGKSKTLLGGGNKGHIGLRPVPVCVMAQVSVNFVVKLGYASAPIRVSVRR